MYFYEMNWNWIYFFIMIIYLVFYTINEKQMLGQISVVGEIDENFLPSKK